jgi:hypothetical protein
LSPSVKSASVQPAAAPARAIASTSSSRRYARSPRRGGRANVQYPQTSRQSVVSGMKTFGE